MVYSPHGDEGQILVSCLMLLVPFTLCSLFLLAMTGPAIGNVFSNITIAL